MKENLYELLKRYEFNKTEPETLVQLVDKAIEKGGEARQELAFLREAARRLLKDFQERHLIHVVHAANKEAFASKPAGGVDGSFMPVGGAGGKWYVPLSCATVIFPSGLDSAPQVEVESGIEVVFESDSFNPNSLAACKEMALETKAILRFGSKFRDSLLFIDGPAIDPPFYLDKDYIHLRCSAFKAALTNGNRVFACAKRVRDSFYKKYALEQFPSERSQVDKFPSDLQLMLFLFSEYWKELGSSDACLVSSPIDVSRLGPDIYRKYADEGVVVNSIFVQLAKSASLYRVDLPFTSSGTQGPPDVQEAANAISAWSYPGQHIPLPIFIADEKCRIRTGCAEVLYQEIMTRTTTSDPADQIILTQLR